MTQVATCTDDERQMRHSKHLTAVKCEDMQRLVVSRFFESRGRPGLCCSSGQDSPASTLQLAQFGSCKKEWVAWALSSRCVLLTI